MNLKKISSILMIFLLPICLNAQTKFNNAQDSWNGFYIGAGMRQSHFLNQTYFQNTKLSRIKGGLGFSYNIQYKFHPLSIGITYYSSTFIVPEIAKESDEKAPIELRGIEPVLNIALLPSSKSFIPQIGIGYQISSLNLPKELSLSTFSSNLDLSNPIISISGIVKFRHFGFKGFYNRTISFKGEQLSDKAMYHFGGTLLIHLTKFISYAKK